MCNMYYLTCFHIFKQEELEQLARTPVFWDPPMITHTSDSHQIASQNKTESKLQIKKNCQKFKFCKNFTLNPPLEVAWLDA